MKKIVSLVAVVATFAVAGSAIAGTCCPSKKKKANDDSTTSTVTAK